MADNFDIDENENPEPTQQPPAPSNNRNFMIALGVLGGLFLLAVIAMIIFLALILPQSRVQREKQIALINVNNTATVAAVTAQAKSRTAATPTRVPPTTTPTTTPTITLKLSATSVVAQPTKTPAPLIDQIDPRTATVSALLTQAAGAKLTATFGPTTTQTLPKTGFAEDVGIPGLIGITILLVVVIFLVRRMRASTAA
jgi:LPXTG-motif cell wall-anchored protein